MPLTNKNSNYFAPPRLPPCRVTAFAMIQLQKRQIVAGCNERLEWSLVDQSPQQSETEWLCVHVTGYKIINV